LTQQVVGRVARLKYDEFMADLISHKFQSSVRESLHKIYPLKICEIRHVSITEKGKGHIPQVAPLAEQPKAEEPKVEEAAETAEAPSEASAQ
jgi:ribosomal protein S3AE